MNSTSTFKIAACLFLVLLSAAPAVAFSCDCPPHQPVCCPAPDGGVTCNPPWIGPCPSDSSLVKNKKNDAAIAATEPVCPSCPPTTVCCIQGGQATCAKFGWIGPNPVCANGKIPELQLNQLKEQAAAQKKNQAAVATEPVCPTCPPMTMCCIQGSQATCVKIVWIGPTPACGNGTVPQAEVQRLKEQAAAQKKNQAAVAAATEPVCPSCPPMTVCCIQGSQASCVKVGWVGPTPVCGNGGTIPRLQLQQLKAAAAAEKKNQAAVASHKERSGDCGACPAPRVCCGNFCTMPWRRCDGDSSLVKNQRNAAAPAIVPERL